MTDHGYNNYYAQEQEQLQWQNYGISELDRTNEVLASNNLLIQRLQKLTEQVSKLLQLIEMQEVSNRNKQVVDCELCNGDHPTGHCPPPDEAVNYVSNQRQWQYQGHDYYQRENNSNYGQGWRQNYGLSNSQYQCEKDEEIIHNFEENEGGEDEKVVKPDLTKLPYPLSFAHEEHNEGDEENMVEKEEEGNQEKVTENKAEIDQIIEEICALFEKKELRRIWTPQYLYLKFMEFLPNQRKKTDDVISVSFWPP
ncbi:hypothetical protein QL285_004841 [Trifolium repens]|nr:hypothetical protein QL285_004841 [Trifolium repens]